VFLVIAKTQFGAILLQRNNMQRDGVVDDWKRQRNFLVQ
jgi:hypothetical protein